jgi:hypothetical protein
MAESPAPLLTAIVAARHVPAAQARTKLHGLADQGFDFVDQLIGQPWIASRLALAWRRGRMKHDPRGRRAVGQWRNCSPPYALPFIAS